MIALIASWLTSKLAAPVAAGLAVLAGLFALSIISAQAVKQKPPGGDL